MQGSVCEATERPWLRVFLSLFSFSSAATENLARARAHTHPRTAMPPSLPPCISSTICAHRQASWFLLATLSPFFLPFLILSVPFLLLFLAPMSCVLFSLLLLYKLQVFMRSKCMRTDKASLNKEYQEAQLTVPAERLFVHDQAPREQDARGKYGSFPACESLEGSDVLCAELYPHHKVGDEEDSNVQSAELHLHHKQGYSEDSNVQSVDSQVHHEEITEGLCIPALGAEENEEDIREELGGQEGITKDKIEERQEEQEGLQEGLQAPPPKRESDYTEETRESMGKESLQEMIQDNKQEEKVEIEEAIDLKGEQEHFPPSVDAALSSTLTSLALTLEGESLDVPRHQCSVPFKRLGEESSEDQDERLESSSHMHPLEETWRELPAIQSVEPDLPAQTTPIVGKLQEGDAHYEQLEVDTPFTEIETQDHIEEEAFATEMRDDVQFQGAQVINLAELQVEREEGCPSKASSSAVPLPCVSHKGLGFQDQILEEQKIMADIDAIKKIVGYESTTHASIMDQIHALYMFLGMEPYHWAAEVDDLERLQAEIELLKVVVGVK